jgi:hypothetical protein
MGTSTICTADEYYDHLKIRSAVLLLAAVLPAAVRADPVQPLLR